MLIHVKRSAEVFGPYSTEEARAYLAAGRLSLSDFAQLEGTADWIPLSSVPGVKSAPPPPPIAGAPIPPSASQQSQKSSSDFRIGPILRDAVIVYLLSFMGGLIVGLTAHEPLSNPRPAAALVISNLLFCIFGFTISGCLATGNRWKHLAYVALFAWFAGVVNVIFTPVTIETWLLGVLVMPFLAAIGGVLSLLIKISRCL
jgi:hypothetical protein